MKALERYVKKSGKTMPYGKSKPKGGGKWEGPDGVKKADQYAPESGKSITEGSPEEEATESASEEAAEDGAKAMGGLGAKKKKKRAYMSE